MTEMGDITKLVFSGGGLLAAAFVGAYEELLKHKYIDEAHLNGFAGASAGSIAAAFLACNSGIEFVKKIFSETDFEALKEDRFGAITQYFSLMTKYGRCSGERMKQWLFQNFEKLTGISDITFQQVFEKFGNELVINGTLLNRYIPVKFDRHNCPDMKVVDAIRISISYPPDFEPVVIDGQYFVDGGIADNYPITIFDNSDRSNASQTLGFFLANNYAHKHKERNAKISNKDEYVEAIIESMRCNIPGNQVAETDRSRTIMIDVCDYSPMNFALKKSDIKLLISHGKTAALEYMMHHPK
jgi:NTE family protein